MKEKVTTAWDLLSLVAASKPEWTALVCASSGEVRKISYSRLKTRVIAAARVLNAHGLRPGDRIGMYFDEIEAGVVLYLASNSLGLVPIGVSPVFSDHYLEKILGKAGASAVIVGPGQKVRIDGPEILRWNRAGVPNIGVPINCDVISEKPFTPVAQELHSPACLITTSGSTGDPKLVSRSHASWLYAARVFSVGFEPEPEQQERFLLNARISHALGLAVLMTSLRLGATMCIPREIDIHTSLEDLSLLDPTYLPLTPRVLNSFQQQDHLEASRNLWPNPSLKVILTGGAAPDTGLQRKLNRKGVDIVEVCGATEVSDIAITPRGQWREGWIGKLCPGVVARLSDDGELLVKTPGMMIGYHGDESATRAVFTDDGFYITGDIAEIDPDGWVRYIGRKKDVINTSEGSNVFPAPVEQLLEALPWVEQALLVGDGRPEIMALLVIANPKVQLPSPGFLDPGIHSCLYEKARQDVADINSGFERVGRVGRIGLFSHSLDENVYLELGVKQRRNRRNAGRHYKRWLDQIYSEPLHRV